MAHGLGGTKDSGLEPFAKRFAEVGADVVLFDYRGFGLSEGEPRQVVDHRRHREDYHAAVAHARALPGLLLYLFNRPVTRARRLRMRVHLVIANHDSIAPPSGMEKVAKRVRGPVRVERLEAGHFDIYLGDPFEQVVKAQTEFIRSI